MCFTPPSFPRSPPSLSPAVLGNNEAKEGRFQDAVHHFSEAIQLYPFDHRYIPYRN